MKYRNFLILILLIFCLVGFTSKEALSQDLTLKYRLTAAWNENVLYSPGNYSVFNLNCWSSDAAVIFQEATPLLRISNANSSKSISKIRVTIQRSGYKFYSSYASPNFIPAYLNPVLTTNIRNDGNGGNGADIRNGLLSSSVEWSFESSPLRPNDSFTFRTGIITTDTSVPYWPRYQDAFWGIGDSNPNDNLLIEVFYSGVSAPLTTRFLDFPITDFNYNYGPDSYGIIGNSHNYFCSMKNINKWLGIQYVEKMLMNSPTPTNTPTRTPTVAPTKTPIMTPTNTPTPAVNLGSVIPRINCAMNNGDGTFRYFLGYTNSNNISVNIAAGTNTVPNKNILTVDNVNTTIQLSVFLPGEFKGQVSIVANQNALVKWTIRLNSGTVYETSSSTSVPLCQPLTPIVECVETLPGGQKVARIGYDNKNNFTLNIPIGQNNKFIPNPQNRNQPVSFLSGRVVNILTVNFTDTLSWMLGGIMATANSNSPSCTISPNSLPICDIDSLDNGVIGKSCQGTITNVTLDGSKSKDPDNTILSYSWTTDCGGTLLNSNSSIATLQLTAPGAGQSVSCKAMLTVNDGVQGISCMKPVSITPCDIDCLNNPVGTAVPDQCGVCAGDGTSCLDCLGIPFGTSKPDKCGICNGNNGCRDCEGTIDGTKKIDECGICGGDGRSCLDCLDSNIRDSQFAIDNRAVQLFKVNTKFAKIITKLGNVKDKKFALKVTKESKKLYEESWQYVWSLPSVITNCANSSVCAQNDNSAVINVLTQNTNKLFKLTKSSYKKLKKIAGTKASHAKLFNQATLNSQANISEINNIPRFASVCGS